MAKVKDLKLGDELLVARSGAHISKVDKVLVKNVVPGECEGFYSLQCRWAEGEEFGWSEEDIPGDTEVTLYEKPQVQYRGFQGFKKEWAEKLEVGDVIIASANNDPLKIGTAKIVKISQPRHLEWYSIDCVWEANGVHENFYLYQYTFCTRLERAVVEEPEETSQEPEETEKMQDKLVFKFEDSVDGATLFNNVELLLPFREYPAGTQLLYIVALGDNVGLYSETGIETFSLKSSQMAFRNREELASCEDVELEFLAQVAFEASKIGQGSSRNDVGTQDLWKSGWKDAWKAAQCAQEPQNSKSDMDEIFEDL